MSDKLEIPDKAIREAARWMKVRNADASESYWRSEMEQLLPYVASLIVAAELERLVDETDWAWAVGTALRARAAELRGTPNGQ